MPARKACAWRVTGGGGGRPGAVAPPVSTRRGGRAGALAQLAVVDAGAEVVRVADHRRPGGAADRRLDLLLNRREGAGDDLHEHRVSAGGGAVVAIEAHRALSSSRLPNRSTVAGKPGCTGTVEPNSSMTAGPATTSPGASRVRS